MKYLFLIIYCIASLQAQAQKKFTGTFSNGYKGAKMSFILSADGKTVSDFTFTGYWRCGGSTETITAGPEKSLSVVNGKISGVVVEPENGGASAFRFDIKGSTTADKASGTFRMSITGLSCDTYLLKWEAQRMARK